MTKISPSTASVETSLVAADLSSPDPSLTPSVLVSARDSLAANKKQMDLRSRIIKDSQLWKGIYYTPTSTQKFVMNLESKRKTLEDKILYDMSHLSKAYDYDINSIHSISANIPKYSKDVPRQLIEYLSEQDDVPTFEDAITNTGSGGAFVELNWVLKQVKLDRGSETEQGTRAAEDIKPDKSLF